VNLYLKIKRCSKDVNITESQYLKHVETTEDREERQLIAKMDPMIVLQYINVSIDVIINLKFEDIENKMVETARNQEIVSARGDPASKDGDGDSDDDDKQGQAQVDKKKMAAAESDYVDDNNTQKDLEISNQLDELVVEDTPQQIRDKVQKIGGKPDQKNHKKDKVRDGTMALKKSKTQSMNAFGTRRMSASEKESMSKYSIKSIQPLDSARGAAQDEQASSYDDSPSCPRIYEEMIQQLEADIRKHIRIEHQLKLHIESVEDRVEELERDLEQLETTDKKTSGARLSPSQLRSS